MYKGRNAERNVEGQNTLFQTGNKTADRGMCHVTDRTGMCLKDAWYTTWERFNLYLITAAC
jgi:hypothetical protein